MQSIPIVVSRLNNNGTKEIYTIQDPINDAQCIRNFYHPIPDFTTLDNHNKQRQHKVRIRRIQSSGSKRKFPKDFFSRDSNRPIRNINSKQNNTIEEVAKETGCFATINQHNLNLYEDQIIETPKFQEKSNQTQRLSNLYINKTLKQTMRKFMSKKQKQPENKKIPQKYIMSFQNTFSGKQLQVLRQECEELDLRAIFKQNNQNIPPVKKFKLLNPTKENCFKKFSIVKDKQNIGKQKSLRD